MQLYSCACGSTLFFESTWCVTCNREVGWCPACRAIRALERADDRFYRCADPSCGVLLVKCINYEREGVCNRCVHADAAIADVERRCDYCRFNQTIPDLSVPGHRGRWALVEAAKRRVFYVLDMLNLPYGNAAEGFSPPLSFDFLGDDLPEDGVWCGVGDRERVITGHADGKITINIREADDAERERLRSQFGEAHRTLIGHFRHEIAHYFWDLLIRNQHGEEFASLFGDPESPSYGDALERYYREGPLPTWHENFVSAYATMHPWEDWAETFALYLDVASVVETAANMNLIPPVEMADLDGMLAAFQRIGVVANELNRTQGLTDLVPEVITPPVEEKLCFVHRVLRASAASCSQASR